MAPVKRKSATPPARAQKAPAQEAPPQRASKATAAQEAPRLSRAEKAAMTRRRMLDAAYAELCEQGFRATTMDAVAQRAGVAVQTLYFTFHTKDALLQEVLDWAVLGDEQLVPPQQPWFKQAVGEPGVVDAVAAMVAGIETVLARVAPLIPVFHAVAADPAGKVYRHSEQLRRDGYADLVDILSAKADRRAGLSRARAIDLVFVLLGPELYRSLVIDCGWSPTEYTDWATATILHDLFGQDPPPPRRRGPSRRR